MPTPVLETKLSVPLLRESRIPRPVLTTRLTDNVDRKITLVSAPAGYGKTTLICEWISDLEDRPAVAWVSMDSDDRDIRRFFTHLLASIARAMPQLPCFGDGEGISPTSDISLLEQSGELINCLSASEGKLLVILDDFHSGETEELNEWLAELVNQAPGNLHIVVSTRQDPGIPLGRLRANNSLDEIRAADLRFTPEETSAFLTEVCHLEPTAQQVAVLESRLEGWIAGINLAGLMLDGQDDTGDLIESISGEHRYIADYLMEEVLVRQPDDLRDFLVVTSCLERFNASLCDAVVNRDTSRDLLSRLYKSNSFLISLDRKDSWYRYHHLFADLLQQRFLRMDKKRQNEVHLAAGRWFEENGWLREAIDHTLTSGDMEYFSSLVHKYVDRVLLGSGDFRSVERWMSAIPEDRIFNWPRLAVIWAWTLFYSMRMSEVVPVLEQIEKMAENDDSILAETDVVRASLVTAGGDIQGGLALYERAYRRSDSTNDAVRGISALGIGYSGLTSGDTKGAVAYLRESVEFSIKAENISVALKAGTYLGLLHIEQGNLQAAAFRLMNMLDSATKWNIPEASMLCMLHAAMADLAREEDRLEDAEALLDQACTAARNFSSLQSWYIQVVKSLTLFSRGDPDAAVTLIEQLLGDEEGLMKMPAIRVTTEACRIRFLAGTDLSSISQNLVTDVEAWLDGLPDSFDQATMASLSALPGHGSEFVPLVKTRALIWLRRFETALNLLRPLHDISVQAGRKRSVIENLILQAIARSALGDEPESSACIAGALKVSQGQSFTRIFADEGPSVARLLYSATNRDDTDSREIARLLGAFSGEINEELRQPEVQTANTGLLEPLSDRELDVLRLMAVGHSNQEIGDQLFISPQTVKAHSRNIYSKLDTHSRTAAVSKARLLGLLPGT